MFAGTHAYFTMEESRTCSVNYFCFGALLIFIGSILLCSLGFTIILPFEKTKSWPQVDCRVVSAEVNQSMCACEEQGLAYPGCSKFSPCLQVIIAYNTTYVQDDQLRVTTATSTFNQGSTSTEGMDNNSGHRITAQVTVKQKNGHRRLDHPISIKTNLTGGIARTQFVHRRTHTKVGGVGTEGDQHWMTSTVSNSAHQEEVWGDQYRRAMLFRSWGDVFYIHCTLQECGDETWNNKETRRFQAKWGNPGKMFPCFVDPDHPDTVILTRTSFWSMLHAVFWPAICLFVGITLWVGLCCGWWSLESDNNVSAYYGGL